MIILHNSKIISIMNSTAVSTGTEETWGEATSH